MYNVFSSLDYIIKKEKETKNRPLQKRKKKDAIMRITSDGNF